MYLQVLSSSRSVDDRTGDLRTQSLLSSASSSGTTTEFAILYGDEL